ncbi:AP-4 complex subunit epsilon-1 [Gaertneriomyces sp. JEL0708]|nr:AP-4 complex subunit epsilon-1 [Gaertneriomyces sp. JEL0708]
MDDLRRSSYKDARFSAAHHTFLSSLAFCKTDNEESVVLSAEREAIRLKFLERGDERVPSGETAELLLRCLVIETHGLPCRFADIKAINLIRSSEWGWPKRIAYTVLTQFLTPASPLCLLMTNTLLADISSPIPAVVLCALTCLASILAPSDEGVLMVQTLLPSVLKCLKREDVRGKALFVLRRIAQVCGDRLGDAPGGGFTYGSDIEKRVRKCLVGGVDCLSGVLACYHGLITNENKEPHIQTSYSALLPAFLHIHTQITLGHIPEYDFQRAYAPFLQIALLEITALLVSHDAQEQANFTSNNASSTELGTRNTDLASPQDAQQNHTQESQHEHTASSKQEGPQERDQIIRLYASALQTPSWAVVRTALHCLTRIHQPPNPQLSEPASSTASSLESEDPLLRDVRTALCDLLVRLGQTKNGNLLLVKNEAESCLKVWAGDVKLDAAIGYPLDIGIDIEMDAVDE